MASSSTPRGCSGQRTSFSTGPVLEGNGWIKQRAWPPARSWATISMHSRSKRFLTKAAGSHRTKQLAQCWRSLACCWAKAHPVKPDRDLSISLCPDRCSGGPVRFRAPVLHDAVAVLGVLVARDIADLRVPDHKLDELRDEWRDSGFDLATDGLVAETQNGVLVGYAAVVTPGIQAVVAPEQRRGRDRHTPTQLERTMRP